LYQQDPLGRFTGLEDDYSRHRPDYPTEAVEFIVRTANLGPHSLLIDAGCGTGISSRLFSARGIPVIGIEPNAAMRARAEAVPVRSGGFAPVYREGRGENTGLPDGCADAVLSAQAFHWFEPALALAEFQRILKPGGWVFLMWNERDETAPCTAAYGDVVRTAANAAEMEQGRHRAGEALARCPLFEGAGLRQFAHRQSLDREGLIGRAFSISFAPREPADARRWQDALGSIFEQYQQQGRVLLMYRTSLYLARKASAG
jgi:SAM-dependent methyltransferase